MMKTYTGGSMSLFKKEKNKEEFGIFKYLTKEEQKEVEENDYEEYNFEEEELKEDDYYYEDEKEDN